MEQNINDMFSNIINDFNFPQTQYTTSLNDTNRNQNIPSNPSMRYVNRQLDTIYELILRYNDNMIQYQRNMTQMVSLINMNNVTFRQRLHEIRNDRNTQYRNANTQQRNRFQNFQNYRNVPFYDWTFQTPFLSTPQNRQLTQQEINSLTTTIIFNDETRDEISETRCPISLDNFQNGDTLCRINGCNHIFKKENLLNWFRRNSKCPICRFDLRNALNNRRNGNSRGRSRTRDVSGNNTNRSPRHNPNRSPRHNTNRSPVPNQENNSEGLMRDPSGNRLDISNNYWNTALDEQLTNMMQTFVDTTLSNNQFNTAAGENIFDISFNFTPIYQTNNTTENNENQHEEENNSDDDSSVIPDNLSVD